MIIEEVVLYVAHSKTLSPFLVVVSNL